MQEALMARTADKAITFRVPSKLDEAFSEHLDDMNKEREVRPITKSAAIISLMVWALKNKPDWLGGEVPDGPSRTQTPVAKGKRDA